MLKFKIVLILAISLISGCQFRECEDHSRIPEVRNEGRQAFYNGVSKNPYPSSSLIYKKVFLYAEWNKGYNDAQIESRSSQ